MIDDGRQTGCAELIMNVDYFDQVTSAWERNEGLYGEERIHRLMEQCKDHGISSVMWRTSVCGKVSYPSSVMTVFDGEYRLSSNSLAEVLKEIDPLAVAVEVAHELGLKIFAWVTLFDSYFPGLEDGFFAKNPHLLMMSRDGKSALRGIPCYVCAETREYRLREARELSDYGLDGIFYSMNSHNICTAAESDVHGNDTFGFNPEVVEEFRQRHGVDVVKADYDETTFYKLHGEYLSSFLKQVKEGLQEKGQQLFVTGGGLEDGDGFYVYGNAKEKASGEYWHQVRVQIDLSQWLDNGPVDRLFIPSFCAEQLPILSERYGEKAKYAWIQADPSYHTGGEEEALRVIKDHLARMARGELNGVTFHEAASFEWGSPRLWEMVGGGYLTRCG